MRHQVSVGIAIGFAAALLCLSYYIRSEHSVKLGPPRRAVFDHKPVHTQSSTLFGSRRQEEEAYRIYRELQQAEYTALQQALDSASWQEAIAVQFDTAQDPSIRFTHRHRLIWDVFSPFYRYGRLPTPLVDTTVTLGICSVREVCAVPCLQCTDWCCFVLLQPTCANQIGSAAETA